MKCWELDNLKTNLGLLRMESNSLRPGSKRWECLVEVIKKIEERIKILKHQHEKAKRAEDTFFKIVKSRQHNWPNYLLGIERASQELDANHGTDFVAFTTEGAVPFQIKASWNYVGKHKERFPLVPVIVIRPHDKDKYIYKIFLRKLSLTIANKHFITVE